MKAFLRELELRLAALDDAGRAEVLRVVKALIVGIGGFGTAVQPTMSATSKLIADLVLWKSMNWPTSKVMEKISTLAKETGPYVDAFVRSL
jgi:ABC-type Fe3+-citrate transport system substrate-binding protein